MKTTANILAACAAENMALLEASVTDINGNIHVGDQVVICKKGNGYRILREIITKEAWRMIDETFGNNLLKYYLDIEAFVNDKIIERRAIVLMVTESFLRYWAEKNDVDIQDGDICIDDVECVLLYS